MHDQHPSGGQETAQTLTPQVGSNDGDSSPGWQTMSWAQAMEDGKGDEGAELWGAFLHRGTVALLSGETSTGKTVLLYRLAHALAEGKPFLGLAPPKPLRVLYVDVESPYGVQQDLLHTIGPVPNFEFAKGIDGQPLSPLSMLPMLHKIAPEYSVIIVDSLQVADPIQDENDNAQATQQLVRFLTIARESGAAIILVHNMGKGHQRDKYAARGASARIDRADTGLILEQVGSERQQKRRLKIVKSRYPGSIGQTIEFEFSQGLNYTATRLPAQQSLDQRILRAMPRLGSTVKRHELAEHLGLDITKEREKKQLDRVLKKLVKQKQLKSWGHGVYGVRDSS